ncbi:hypothetical protein [Aeromicrobium sp. IC_218]|uniref:hypothetical protein n=1 Tax=Aeromicrobium sp. IC_218 TaxID=2545468 RepID=UPI0010401E33|nr:hypothetical protein [Aeromicrobium sp. IC_218]TCJ00878.1 hypothetical protein E0W78_02020 [Aeromicrobium sp. IC_218]
MHTWIKRSLGVAAVAGGLMLAGAATAHADDGSQPSHRTSLSAPVSIGTIDVGLGRESHERSTGRTGCGCSGSGDSRSSERSGLEVEVGRTTLDPVATLGGSGGSHHGERGATVKAPVDVEKVTAGLGSTEERSRSHSGSTTTRESASGLGVDVREVAADPAATLGGDRGLEVAAPVDVEKVAAGLGRQESSTTTGTPGHTGGTTAEHSESGLGLDVGELTTHPVVDLDDTTHDTDSNPLIDVPLDLDGIELGLGTRDSSTTTGAPGHTGGTTTEHSESGLGLDVGELTTHPVVDLADTTHDTDSNPLIDVPLDLDGIELGLGTRESSTTTGTPGHTGGTTTEHSEAGLGLDVGELTTHPVVDLDGLLTVELPISLGGIDLGLGRTETSTSTGPDAPAPGDGGTPTTPVAPTTPVVPTTPTQPATPTAPTAPGGGQPSTDDGSTGGQPSTGDTDTLPVPGTEAPGTSPGGTLPGLGGDGGSGLPDLVGGLLGAVVGTVTGGLEDVVEGLLGGGQPTTPTVPQVPSTDPGTRPEPVQPAPAPAPADPGTEGPDTDGTPPAEGPDCGCAGGDAGATDDVTDTVGDVVGSTTEVVDEVVETVTETVSDTVDTVTDVVDGVTDGLTSTGTTQVPAEDDDC